MLHDNCQNRPRTFVYFFKRDSNIKGVPELQFENKQISVEELLNRIPKNDNDTMNVTLKLKPVRQALYDYLINNESDSFRKILTSAHVLDVLYKDNKLRDFEKYIINSSQYSESFKKRISDYINIIYNKRSQNKNFWHEELNVIKDDIMPTCMHRTMESVLHYKENRLYTLREWLTTMGMPFDFKLYGDILKVYKQIGQNVPVRTAKFIIDEALGVINNDNVKYINNSNVVVFDNIKQSINVLN
jgi:site-specific DNA-cytosine methylase